MRLPVNLATRPFRNERLPSALVLLLSIVALAGTVVHVAEVRRLMGKQATAVDAEAQALDAELAQADAEVAKAQTKPPPAERLARWGEIQGLVDRRAFAWTAVLAAIERTLPEDVRVISLSPKLEKGGLELAIVASGRDSDAALGLLSAFRVAPEFADARPTNVGEKEGEAGIAMTVRVRGARK